MKKLSLLAVTLLFAASIVVPVGATSHLAGKVIALDAGHGGTELGAQYPANAGDSAQIFEKDVNLATVYALKAILEASGATVVLTRVNDETLSSRKERVASANAQCEELGGKRCDVLVSIHHNGSVDSTYNGTLVIYNEKRDIPLAESIHDSLIISLGLDDEGYLHGGYGMTVFGRTVSVITEGYYITNDDEAQMYLAGESFNTPDGYSVLIGSRVNQEAQAIHDGIANYFNSKGSDEDSGDKGNNGKKPNK